MPNIMKYIDLAKNVNYVYPNKKNIIDYSSEEIINASINEFLKNDIQVLSCVIVLNQYPIMYPIVKMYLKRYIKLFS